MFGKKVEKQTKPLYAVIANGISITVESDLKLEDFIKEVCKSEWFICQPKYIDGWKGRDRTVATRVDSISHIINNLARE